MEYKLSEQELKDLMHRSWLKAKNFYSGNTDEYFYDYFESEKKQLNIHSVSFEFNSLINRLVELLNIKYPNRQVNNDFVENLKIVWKGKEVKLKANIEALEKELNYS
tara:strand:+ start:646 stop:966 length:321 start_codon:yes stop_codon:yes gene_type:complete